MSKKYIARGIEAYAEEQQEILDAIESHAGKLTQTDFDEHFSDYTVETKPDGEKVLTPKPPKLKLHPTDEKAFILGSLAQSGDRVKYLHLTQLMCIAGILTAQADDDGVIVYSKR